MKLFFLLFTLALSAPALVSARIGETREQCEARYGKPTGLGEDYSFHEKSGLQVVCIYHAGKCDCIAFNQLEMSADKKTLPLSDTMIQTLLKANSAGQTWRETGLELEGNMGHWECASMTAEYYLDKSSPVLRIVTRAFSEREFAKESAGKGRPKSP
jgi:hypothetical protein